MTTFFALMLAADVLTVDLSGGAAAARQQTAEEIAQQAAAVAIAESNAAVEAAARLLPRTEPTGIHVPTNGLLVVDAPSGAGYQVIVDEYGVDAIGPVHGSPWIDATARELLRQARRAERQAVRDGFRKEIEDSKTNRARCITLITAQTNGIAQMQALAFSATPTRAQVQALRDACVADAQRQRDVIAELRQANAELIDVLRLLRRQLLDTRPEVTTP